MYVHWREMECMWSLSVSSHVCHMTACAHVKDLGIQKRRIVLLQNRRPDEKCSHLDKNNY